MRLNVHNKDKQAKRQGTHKSTHNRKPVVLVVAEEERHQRPLQENDGEYHGPDREQARHEPPQVVVDAPPPNPGEDPREVLDPFICGDLTR